MNLPFNSMFDVGRSMFNAPLWISFLLASTLTSHAILDVNENGVSDLWEKRYNNGVLYETFDPDADPDQDGWTNAQEAVAGTDPLEANPPVGFLRPEITHISAVYETPEEEGDEPVLLTPEAICVNWPTIPGKTYALFSSVDLTPGSWLPVGGTRVASGSTLGGDFPLNPSYGSAPPAQFFRVAVEDTDTDGDTLTDAEEHVLGTSIYLEDTDDDGLSDLAELAMGTSATSNGSDVNADGVPDGHIYSVEFELEHETHFVAPPQHYAASDREELNARYFSRDQGTEYSISGSPRYVDIAEGLHVEKSTSLEDGVLRSGWEQTVTEEGMKPHDWQNNNQVALATGEYIVWTDYQETVAPLETTVTGDSTRTATTTTTTRAWQVKAGQTVVRSGTETHITTPFTKYYDLMPYTEVWADLIKPAAWQSSTEEFGALHNIGQLLGSVYEPEAARIVRSLYRDGLSWLPASISHPRVGFEGGGTDTRLKSLRWRWIRFDPKNPFDYSYSAPPASYRKTFLLPVTRSERVTGSPDQVTAAGIVEVECLGSQGAGWQDAPMERFADYKIEDPTCLATVGFSGKQGSTEITASMMPSEVVSRDRMIAGKLAIPREWEEGFEIRFVNTTTGEDLGTYGNLNDDELGPRFDRYDTYLFDEWERQKYEANTLDARIRTQNVIFCGRQNLASDIEFYTVFKDLGNVEIKLIHKGQEVGAIKHTLVEDAAFGRIIDYVNELVGEPPADTPPVGVAAAAPINMGGQAADMIRPLARRALVPFFNGFGAWLAAQPDAEVLVLGLLEGIKQGALDDWKLIQWVNSNVVVLKHALPAVLALQTQRWIEDPYTRAMETANAVRNLVEHGLMEPMRGMGGQLGDFAGNFTSWERLKEFNWKVHQGLQMAQVVAWQITLNTSEVILRALGDWYVEFCGRMYEGAELGVFASVSMGDLPAWRQDIRTFYRTFGYSFGYLGEQLLLGKGIGALGKGMAKLGPQIALTTLPPVKAAAVRILPFLDKRWAARIATTADHEAAHQAVRAAQTGRLDSLSSLAADGSRPVAELLDEAIARQMATLNGKLLAEEIHNSPKILQTLRQEATRTIFFTRLGTLERLIGAKLDDIAAKNFTRMYERTILLIANTGEDMFDLTIKSFHSNFAPNGPIDNISAAGKDLLEFFLKDPNGGSPWKLGFAGSPNQNLGTLVRGNLVELHSAKVGRHKTASYLDELKDGVVEGIDFEYADGLLVQQTSTALSAASDQMVAKLDNAARAALAAKGEGCRFQFDVHWLSNNGKPDFSRLEGLAATLREDLEIVIEIVDTPTPFNQWIP